MPIAELSIFFRDHFSIHITSCELTAVADTCKYTDLNTGIVTLGRKHNTLRLSLTVRGKIAAGKSSVACSYGCLQANPAVLEFNYQFTEVRLSLIFTPADGPEALELAKLLKVIE